MIKNTYAFGCKYFVFKGQRRTILLLQMTMQKGYPQTEIGTINHFYIN